MTFDERVVVHRVVSAVLSENATLIIIIQPSQVMEVVAPKFEDYSESARGLLAGMSFPEAFSRLLGSAMGLDGSFSV